MKLIQAFVQRDQINKHEVIRAFKVNGELDIETLEKIDRAFEIGASKWQENTKVVFGEEEAARLMDMLGKTI